MFSAAALHLRFAHQPKDPGKPIKYADYELLKLNLETQLKYYQATTAYLRALCKDEKHTKDEDLLAATVIMRFYAELLEAKDESRPSSP